MIVGGYKGFFVFYTVWNACGKIFHMVWKVFPYGVEKVWNSVRNFRSMLGIMLGFSTECVEKICENF